MAIDARIASLAERQHGVVSRRQLATLGLDRGAVALRRRNGRLYLVHRGVYAVGHRLLTRQGRWMAAVLACGSGCALSHASAGAAWDLASYTGTLVHVAGCPGRRPRPGIRMHATRTLTAGDITTIDSIAVTTIARTLSDLATFLPAHRLERAFDRALHLRLLDVTALLDILDRAPNRRGVGTLRQLATDAARTPLLTRSNLENAFVAFADAHALPRPRCNHHVPNADGELVEVDAFWAPQRLVVELDSWTHHGDRGSFERDRAKDAALLAAGYIVVRITWRQLHEEPVTVARRLRPLLAR
jgi:hypothetical protein